MLHNHLLTWKPLNNAQMLPCDIKSISGTEKRSIGLFRMFLALFFSSMTVRNITMASHTYKIEFVTPKLNVKKPTNNVKYTTNRHNDFG